MIYVVSSSAEELQDDLFPEGQAPRHYFGTKRAVMAHIRAAIRMVNQERREVEAERREELEAWGQVSRLELLTREDFELRAVEVPRTKRGILRLLRAFG